jgi:hypothetical protein
MLRLSAAICLTLAVVLPASAQATIDSIDPNEPSMIDNSPRENVQQFRSRAPGLWVQAALSRHIEIQNERLRGGGTEPNEPPTPEPLPTPENGSGLLGSLGSLTGLLGGNLGSLGDLGGLLGGTTGTTGSTGPATGGMSVADLLALAEAAGVDTSGVSGTAGSDAVQKSSTSKSLYNQTRTIAGQTYGGAIGRLSKPEDRFQETQEERKFTARLLEGWATAFIAAVTLGFQSDFFIEALKDTFRPLLAPSTVEGGGDSGGTSGSGSSNGGSGSSSGGGIEDAGSSGGGSGGGSSTI